MSARSSSLLVLFLLVGAVLAIWLLVWQDAGSLPGPTDTEEDTWGSSPSDQASGAPGLQVREGGAATSGAGLDAAETTHADDWVIEIAEILGPDGQAALGADVFIDGAAYANELFTSLTWNGEALHLRLRRQLPDAAVAPEREDMTAYAPNEPLYISVRHDDYARWFAPALLCPSSRKTTLRARLRPHRRLHGTVRRYDGGLVNEVATVHLTRPGVPETIYATGVAVDAEGHFEFDPEDIPAGRVVLRAHSEMPAVEGCPVSVEVAPTERSSPRGCSSHRRRRRDPGWSQRALGSPGRDPRL